MKNNYKVGDKIYVTRNYGQTGEYLGWYKKGTIITIKKIDKRKAFKAYKHTYLEFEELPGGGFIIYNEENSPSYYTKSTDFIKVTSKEDLEILELLYGK